MLNYFKSQTIETCANFLFGTFLNVLSSYFIEGRFKMFIVSSKSGIMSSDALMIQLDSSCGWWPHLLANNSCFQFVSIKQQSKQTKQQLIRFITLTDVHFISCMSQEISFSISRNNVISEVMKELNCSYE